MTLLHLSKRKPKTDAEISARVNFAAKFWDPFIRMFHMLRGAADQGKAYIVTLPVEGNEKWFRISLQLTK